MYVGISNWFWLVWYLLILDLVSKNDNLANSMTEKANLGWMSVGDTSLEDDRQVVP